MNLGQAKEQGFRLVNEFSINGTPVLDTNGNYIDIKNRMYVPANTAQIRLANIIKIPGKFTISQNPITNLLGLYAFNEVQHFPSNNLTYTSVEAKSFSVEVDGACTISFDEYVSGTWTPLNGTYYNGTSVNSFSGSITVSGITTFTNYRGLLTIASATNNVRMTITTTYPIKSRYRGLFAYAYATADKVPWLRAYVPYDAPEDYWKFNKMMRAYDERQFTENKDYILTSDKKIYINYFLTGEFEIHYWKYPTEITVNTADSYEFEVSQECQALIPWFMGGQAIMPDDSSIGSQITDMYFQMEAQLSQEEPMTPESSEDTYGW